MSERLRQADSYVTIVTHQTLPMGAPDDILLASAFSELGVKARCAAWDDPKIHWSETNLAIVRSTWDYHLDPESWMFWVDRTANDTMLLNPRSILQWNADKRYLRELADAGVPCVPTVFVETTDGLSLRSILDDQGWSDIVIKPAFGASSSGVRRFKYDSETESAEIHVAELAKGSSVLVQPYIEAVESERERSLVFIDGIFSHAFTKSPFNTNATGGSALSEHGPSSLELAVATRAIAVAPDKPVYARVDLVPSAGGTQIMELELIEPDLGLRNCKQAAIQLTEACLSRT